MRFPSSPWARRLLLLIVIAAVGVGSLWLLAAGSEESADAFERDAAFVTTRSFEPGRDASVPFRGGRGALSQGRCRVRFNPIPGAEAVADRVRFFVPTQVREVIATERQEAPAFWAALDAQAGETLPVVLFVHGYSYSFARACRMGAELQRMLEGKAAVVLFTWPSDANPADYVADQVDVEWSVPELATLISTLRRRYGEARLKVLAHSLGTRGVLFALDRLAAAQPERPLVDELVLLAPDFDAGSFRRDFQRRRPLARSVTLYASDTDTPLAVSAALHGHPRLGQAGDALTLLPGLETIDVTPVGRYQITGHEYFYYHPIVAADLIALLTGEEAHPARERRQGPTGPYWELQEH